MNGHFHFKDKTNSSKEIKKIYAQWYASLSKKDKRKLSNYNETFPKGLTRKQLRKEKKARKLSSI